MFFASWKMLRESILAFISDGALSCGAAIAFYTVTSIAPVLLIVIAIAGFAFGRDAAQNAITASLSAPDRGVSIAPRDQISSVIARLVRATHDHRPSIVFMGYPHSAAFSGSSGQ